MRMSGREGKREKEEERERERRYVYVFGDLFSLLDE